MTQVISHSWIYVANHHVTPKILYSNVLCLFDSQHHKPWNDNFLWWGLFHHNLTMTYVTVKSFLTPIRIMCPYTNFCLLLPSFKRNSRNNAAASDQLEICSELKQFSNLFHFFFGAPNINNLFHLFGTYCKTSKQLVSNVFEISSFIKPIIGKIVCFCDLK